MNRFGGIKLPPLSAAANVASQLKRQILPSASPEGHSQPGQGHGERVSFFAISLRSFNEFFKIYYQLFIATSKELNAINQVLLE